MLFSLMLNQFLYDIIQHNVLLQKNKYTTYQFLITPTQQKLKDGALSGSANPSEGDHNSDINCLALNNL